MYKTGIVIAAFLPSCSATGIGVSAFGSSLTFAFSIDIPENNIRAISRFFFCYFFFLDDCCSRLHHVASRTHTPYKGTLPLSFCISPFFFGREKELIEPKPYGAARHYALSSCLFLPLIVGVFQDWAAVCNTCCMK